MNLDGSSLLAGFVVSTVGFGFFSYGRKQGRPPQIVFGVISMIYPYFFGAPWIVFAIFAGLLALLYLAIRIGW